MFWRSKLKRLPRSRRVHTAALEPGVGAPEIGRTLFGHDGDPHGRAVVRTRSPPQALLGIS
eukprot:scaffold267897_cov19-Tisochrysis_lutea.AAC.1